MASCVAVAQGTLDPLAQVRILARQPPSGLLPAIRGHGLTLAPKIRELISDLERAGFINRGGRGNHRNFVHPNVVRPVTISGNLSSDAKNYQVRAVRAAIEESENEG